MKTRHYILSGHDPVPVADPIKWAEWFETADRRVALTEIGDVTVSTVFLGIDHNWGAGPPLLFETMIFRDGIGGDEDRCSTWAEAEEQHRRVVAEVFPA